MNPIEKKTYCRICEPMCGLQVEVEDGRIVKVKGSKEHVLSKGHLCAKAQAASEVSYDKDRILYPLKKNHGSGEFERVSWQQAISEIAKGLKAVRKKNGKSSVATYSGNPLAFASGAQIWLGALKKLLGVKWSYGVGSEDTVAVMTSARLLYGSPGHILKPDIWRTDFVMVMGANPYVSHSSLFTEPLLREAFTQVKDRGGRVVVVDPRRTETARRNEHVGIHASTDAYLLMAMLQTIIDEDLVDTTAISDKIADFARFTAELSVFTPEFAAGHTGVPVDSIRQLARDFANAKSACIVGRTGTCTQRFGTLSNMLMNVMCLVTGNVDREGGMLFGEGLVNLSDFLEKAGGPDGEEVTSRTTGLTSVVGILPSTAMPTDILEPGIEQVRALISVAANPMLNSPAGGESLERALDDLELFVSLDFYVNETNRHADYILPTTTMFERDDMPLFGLDAMLRPSVWVTEAVADPQGEVKPEWKIFNELAQEIGFGGAYESVLFRGLARLGIAPEPKFFFDLMIRTSQWGDKFGFKRNGLSFKKLVQDHPNGYRLMEHLPTNVFNKKIKTGNGRVNLGQEKLLSEIERLRSYKDEHPKFPYRLISQREMLSQNSWLHNVNTTMNKKREHTAKVHPDDASRHGLADGDIAYIESPWGQVSVPIRVLEDMTPGNIALPHGWGHKGGSWKRANQAGGVCSNILASDRPQDAEAISGGSLLNGVPVRIRPANEQKVVV